VGVRRGGAPGDGGAHRRAPDGTGAAVGLSREAVELWGAARTVSMHVTGGTCASCEPEGQCLLYRWADLRLRQWEREHGPFPDRAPAWHDVNRPH